MGKPIVAKLSVKSRANGASGFTPSELEPIDEEGEPIVAKFVSKATRERRAWAHARTEIALRMVRSLLTPANRACTGDQPRNLTKRGEEKKKLMDEQGNVGCGLFARRPGHAVRCDMDQEW